MIILGTNSIKDTGYEVDNSCRFNRGSSDTLTRTPSSASNRRTWTWSGWVKRSGLGNIQTLFNGSDGGNPEIFYFDADDKFLYQHDIAGADYKLISSQVFRDVSAWYHIVVAKDTTQSTETNRLKVYVNGSQITMNESALGYPTQNFEGAININDLHIIGNWKTNSYYVDGYLCEVAFIDGSQLDATSFGEFNSDSPTIWQPIDVSGLTFGTNGFYLDFEDSSALGNDAAGSNNFTVNNLTATDQSTDTCTNNFATLNGAVLLTDVTLSEGNLKAAFGSAGTRSPAGATLAPTSGKWYYEVKLIASSAGNYISIGYADIYANGTQLGNYTTASSLGFGINAWDGTIVNRTTTTTSAPGNFAMTPDDILGVYLDIDNLQQTFTLNGTQHSSGYDAITASTTGFYIPTIGDAGGSQTISAEINFGSPTFAISSSNTDANGYGNFEYSPTIGGVNFYALNTKNLSEYG